MEAPSMIVALGASHRLPLRSMNQKFWRRAMVRSLPGWPIQMVSGSPENCLLMPRPLAHRPQSTRSVLPPRKPEGGGGTHKKVVRNRTLRHGFGKGWRNGGYQDGDGSGGRYSSATRPARGISRTRAKPQSPQEDRK